MTESATTGVRASGIDGSQRCAAVLRAWRSRRWSWFPWVVTLDVDARNVVWATIGAVVLDALLIADRPDSLCSASGDVEVRKIVLGVAGLLTLLMWVFAARAVWRSTGRGQRALVVVPAVVPSVLFVVLVKIGSNIPVHYCA